MREATATMEPLELGKRPISLAQPVGMDVKFEPEFESLQQEIDKLTIPSLASRGIDWVQVSELAQRILDTKSKNLLVGCYLSVGWAEVRGPEGLADSLVVLKDLVEVFWDTMYPPKVRIRARTNALEWWIRRVEIFIQQRLDKPLPEELKRRLVAGLTELNQALQARCEEAPMLAGLIQQGEAWPSQAKPGAPTPAAPGPPSPGPAPPGSTPRPAPASAPPRAEGFDSPQKATNHLEQCLLEVLKVADYLLQQDPTSPLPYRLNRLTAWSTLDTLPVASGQQTLIPPPEPSVRSSLEGMLGSRHFEQLLLHAESRVREFLFWLDLSHFTFQALDLLGGSYRLAKETVARETALLVQRLPGIELLGYADGTPFADDRTRAWLKRHAPRPGEEAEAPVQAAGSGHPLDAEIAEQWKAAQSLLKSDQPMQAVELLQGRMEASGSEKARFLWRIALIGLFNAMGQTVLARSHLDMLVEQIERFQLGIWEPELAVRALQVAHQILFCDNDAGSKALAEKMLSQVARISPRAAFSILKR